MYGLLIENILGYIRSHYHPKRYEEIKALAKLPFEEVDIDKVYPEGYVIKIGKKASLVLQVTEAEIFEGVGVYFVTITKHLGLRKTITSIAREFREFIMNLDNAHDYFKLRFTKMKAPSFFVDQEHERGLTLHYRSRRRGFAYYALGQMKEIAKVVYKKELHIELKRQEIVFDMVIVTYTLTFDNSAYVEQQRTIVLRQESSLPVKAHIFFEIFPFSVLFTEKLVITLVGATLRLVMPCVIGQPINECFYLVRPMVEFSAEQILQRTNNVWVLRAMITPSKVMKYRKIELMTEVPSAAEGEDGEEDRLHIKGIMMYMPMWKKILFIGCPVISDLRHLVMNGLFINDLSMHDYSRDIMITSSQFQMEERMTKKLLKDQAEILDSMENRYELITKSNEMTLHSWVPAQLSHLAADERPVQTLEFAAVMFAMVDRLEVWAGTADPVQMIDLMDDVLRVFDHLTETIGVFKIETTNHYLALADFTAGHSELTQLEKVASLALDLDNAAKVALRAPSPRGKALRFKIAVNCGPAVAAVVGGKLPKLCLFGRTLKEAERMAEFCPAGRIIMPEELKVKLPPSFKFKTVANEKWEHCVYIDGKLNYHPVPVMPILHAYSAFKAGKMSRQLAKGSGGGENNVVNDVEVVTERKSFCQGFVGGISGGGSSVCNIA